PVRPGRRRVLTPAPGFTHPNGFQRCWVQGHVSPWLKALGGFSIGFCVCARQRRTERLRGVHSCWVLKHAELAAKVIFLNQRVRLVSLRGGCLRRRDALDLNWRRCLRSRRRLREYQRHTVGQG